jgi:hypothetical protein
MRMHGCDSRHVGSKPVREVFQGELAWEGIVEEFALIDHPKANTCFAWSYRDGDTMRSVAVLALPPVDSPENAVKIAIAAEAAG